MAFIHKSNQSITYFEKKYINGIFIIQAQNIVINIGICVFQIALIAHIKLICTHNNQRNKEDIRTI
jgi:hypothetical protein